MWSGKGSNPRGPCILHNQERGGGRVKAQLMTMIMLSGCLKKNFTLGIYLISPAIYMLECWHILHLKVGIYRSVWSTKTFLHDIREPRYKQNNMGIRFQEYQGYLILPGCIPDFSSYEHFNKRGYIRPLVCFRFNPFSVLHKGAEI